MKLVGLQMLGKSLLLLTSEPHYYRFAYRIPIPQTIFMGNWNGIMSCSCVVRKWRRVREWAGECTATSKGMPDNQMFALSDGSFRGFILSVNSKAKIYCFPFLFTFAVSSSSSPLPLPHQDTHCRSLHTKFTDKDWRPSTIWYRRVAQPMLLLLSDVCVCHLNDSLFMEVVSLVSSS